jgi:hypothetical protein
MSRKHLMTGHLPSSSDAAGCRASRRARHCCDPRNELPTDVQPLFRRVSPPVGCAVLNSTQRPLPHQFGSGRERPGKLLNSTSKRFVPEKRLPRLPVPITTTTIICALSPRSDDAGFATGRPTNHTQNTDSSTAKTCHWMKEIRSRAADNSVALVPTPTYASHRELEA